MDDDDLGDLDEYGDDRSWDWRYGGDDDPALDPPRGPLPPVPALDRLGNAVTPGRVPGRG